MSSVTVCNCPQNTPDLACLQAISSRPSDQQQKKPDGRTCWAGSMERRLDGCWQNAGAGGKQCPKLVCSGRSDTEELGRAGIGTWAHRAYTGLVLERQANGAQCAWDVTECLFVWSTKQSQCNHFYPPDWLHELLTFWPQPSLLFSLSVINYFIFLFH